jgi:ligand-binding sensor domain-containing protein
VGAYFFGKIPSILWVKTWKEVLDLLTEEWGDKARVAVYPDGTIQYLRAEGSKQ